MGNKDAKISDQKPNQLIESFNNINPHSALGMKSPLGFAKEREVMLAS